MTRGEVDLGFYAERDLVWRELGLAAPARRALVNAGILTIAQLRKLRVAEIAELHGVGKNALKLLTPYLRQG